MPVRQIFLVYPVNRKQFISLPDIGIPKDIMTPCETFVCSPSWLSLTNPSTSTLSKAATSFSRPKRASCRRSLGIKLQQQQQQQQGDPKVNTSRLVKVQKPLGLKLEELKNRNIVVAQVDPSGNGATQGKIQAGEIILGIRDEQGSKVNIQGVGLERAMQLIQNSQGDSLELVLEPAFVTMDSGFDPADVKKKLQPQVREKLRQEIISPYKNNWILIIVAIVLSLVVASYVML
jgi:hypothetical protein